MNFKVIKVSGASKAEAFESVADKFTVIDGNLKGEATQAWKKWTADHQGVVDFQAFANEYLTKKRAVPGEAYFVTEQAAILDSREKPFQRKNVVHDGPRTQSKAYQFVDEETGVILGQLSTEFGKEVPVFDAKGNPVLNEDGTPKLRKERKFPTKEQAYKYAESLIKNGDDVTFRGTIAIKEIRELENDVVGYLSYAPSKSTRAGIYTVFGIEK